MVIKEKIIPIFKFLLNLKDLLVFNSASLLSNFLIYPVSNIIEIKIMNITIVIITALLKPKNWSIDSERFNFYLNLLSLIY